MTRDRLVSAIERVAALSLFMLFCAQAVETPLWSVRIGLLVLSTYNMVWTVPGVVTTFRMRPKPLAMFQSSIFFLSAGTLAFQMFAVFGTPNDVTRLASGATLLVGMGAAATLRSQSHYLGKFSKLLVAVDVALAITDLAIVDRPKAEEKAEECRKLTALAVARG